MAFRHDTQTVRVVYGAGTKVDEQHIDFDLPDYKGRRIGYNWSLYTVEVWPANDAAKSVYMQTPELAAAGKLYRLYSTATRNGERFGGAGGFEYFLTATDAIKAVMKKAASARKRYAAQPVERR